ncbi:MAG: hypothetical protein NVS4B2_08320 [Chloroflexota bacterium]
MRSKRGLAAGIFFVLLIAAGIALFVAVRSLRHGIVEARAAESQMRTFGSGGRPHVILARATQSIKSARADFRRADTILQPVDPILSRLGWMPRYGDEIAAAPTAARIANRLADGLLALLTGVAPLAPAAPGGSASLPITAPRIMSTLVQSHARFQYACDRFHQALAARHRLTMNGARGTVSAALRSFDRQLPRIVSLCQALLFAPDLLGLNHPHTYLIAYQDPDELRSTGGFLGSIGFLTLKNGVATQQFQGTGIRDNLSIPPPEPVSLYNRESGWLLRDANWSPNFPTSADLERFFVQLDLHRGVSDVINVTPAAIAGVLSATGPLYLHEYGRTVTGANLADLTDYYTHRTRVPGPYHYASGDTERKQFIQIVGRHVLQRLQLLSVSGWLHLGSYLSQSVAQGDVLVHLGTAGEQALVRSLGASGEIKNPQGDYVYVVDTNLSYNKINPYVHVTMKYLVHIQANRWLHARLSISFHNGPIPPEKRGYGIGPGAGRLGNPDDYASFLRVFVPVGGEILSQSGWEPWSPGPAYGKTMFSGYVTVPVGSDRTVNVEYVVPPNVLSWSKGARYRLTIPHQPGSYHTRLQVSVVDDAGTSTTWSQQPLLKEWQRTIPIVSRRVNPIPLPLPLPSVVRPGHWIEPHAFLAAPAR